MQNLTLQYFLLSMVLLILLIFVISMHQYAKWHKYGPKWKKLGYKIRHLFKKDANVVTVSKSEQIRSNIAQIDSSLNYAMENQVSSLSPDLNTQVLSAQELLKMQNQKVQLQTQLQKTEQVLAAPTKRKLFIFKKKTTLDDLPKQQTIKNETNNSKQTSLASEISINVKKGIDWDKIEEEFNQVEFDVASDKLVHEIASEIVVDHWMENKESSKPKNDSIKIEKPIEVATIEVEPIKHQEKNEFIETQHQPIVKIDEENIIKTTEKTNITEPNKTNQTTLNVEEDNSASNSNKKQ